MLTQQPQPQVEIKKTGILVSSCIDALDKEPESSTNSPISEKCRLTLQVGPPCEDGYKTFTGQRRYVLCRAFNLLETGKTKSFGEGIRQAWNEVDTKCTLGIYKPP